MRQPVRSLCIVHTLLYFTSIGAGPVRSQAATCAIHFQAGDIYNYAYSTHVSLNEANNDNLEGAHRSVGFRVSADLRLSVVWKKSYDYLMKLEVLKSNIHSISRLDLSSDFQEVRRNPVFFHWHGDGTVGRVYLPMNEVTMSANIKKGIISMLQMQTVDGERVEVDASGECQVEYTITGNKVTKKKHSCKNLEKSGQYHHTSSMFDSDTISYTSTTYEFADDVITSAEGTDTQAVLLNADKSIDALAASQQVLKLLEKRKGEATILQAGNLDDAVEAADPGFKLDLIGMLLGTDVDSPSCFVDCVSLMEAVEEQKHNLMTEKLAHIESPQAFVALLPVFRQASKEKVVAVLNKYPVIRPQLLDLVAAAQTEASLEAVLEVLDFNSPTNYQLPERFIMATSFATHPRESLLKVLLKLFQQDIPSAELKESISLSLGAVTHTFCQFEDQCSHKIVRDIESSLLSTLASCDSVACTLQVTRAMRNAKLWGTRDALLKLLETDSNNDIISAAMQAVLSMSRHSSTVKTLSVMSRIYHQNLRNYDSGVRTAALELLLTAKPTVQEIRNILLSTINQTDYHMATYVMIKMTDLAQNSPVFNEKLRAAMNDSYIKNYNTFAPGGTANALTSYLGRSKFTDVMYQLFMQSSQTGIMKKSAMQVILDNGSSHQPVLMFSLYAQGLESVIDSSAVPEGVEPEDPTAGLSLDVLDVLLRPVEFFRGSGGLMSAVWSAPSDPVSALGITVITQDKKQRIYLQNGFVLEHTLTGVVSIDLSGFISISLWNQDAHSVIKNSGATVLQGSLKIAANSYLNAGLNFSLEASAFIDFTTDVNFYVKPPQLCLRMAQDPFIIRQTWTKTEQGRGIPSKVTYKLKRKQPVAGASFLLDERNSRECTKLLEK